MSGTGLRLGTAAIAAVLLAGCGAEEVVVPVDPTATSPTASAVVEGEPTPTASGTEAKPAAEAKPATDAPVDGAAARLDVALSRTSPDGARAVAVTADITGVVPQLVDGGGTPLAAEQTEVMGTHVLWGDGAQDGSDAGDVQCTTSGARVKLAETFDLKHIYAKPGRYTVSFTAGACPPLHDVTKKLVVVVR
jgi:hypothetical protein